MPNNTMLDAIDPEILDTLVSRREVIARGVKVSTFTTAALALGSVPVALGALATTAGAQGTANVVVDVLQYALFSRTSRRSSTRRCSAPARWPRSTPRSRRCALPSRPPRSQR